MVDRQLTYEQAIEWCHEHQATVTFYRELDLDMVAVYHDPDHPLAQELSFLAAVHTARRRLAPLPRRHT